MTSPAQGLARSASRLFDCCKTGLLLAAVLLAVPAPGGPTPAAAAASESDLETLRSEFRTELNAVRRENADLRGRLNAFEKAKIDESRRLDDIQLKVEQSEGLNAGYDKNFYIKSADNNFRLNFSGFLQFQGNFFENNPIPDRAQPIFNAGLAGVNRDDTFFMRRVRAKLSGNVVTPDLTFTAELEYAGGNAAMRDGFINYHFKDYAEIKMGQFKPPFSLENLESDSDIETIERAAVVALLGLDRRVGAQVHGKFWNSRLEYAAGIFNNLGFGNQGQNASDTNDDKALVARLVFNPFATSDNKWTKDLSLSAAVASGPNGPTSSSAGIPVVDIVAGIPSPRITMLNTVPFIGGNQTQYDIAISWIIDRFRLKGEYISSNISRRDVPVTTQYPFGAVPFGSIVVNGGYVQLSYVAVDRPHMTIVPVFKYEMMHIKGDDMVFTQDINSNPGTGSANVLLGRFKGGEWDNDLQAITVGATWFINPKFKIMANWIFEEVGEDLIGSTRLRAGEDTDQNIFMVRSQLKF